MIEKKRRLIHLSSKYRELCTCREDRVVPWLTVSGIWLQSAGFKPGDCVEITIGRNELIIKNLSVDGDH
jgi:hypothetical protein